MFLAVEFYSALIYDDVYSLIFPKFKVMGYAIAVLRVVRGKSFSVEGNKDFLGLQSKRKAYCAKIK